MIFLSPLNLSLAPPDRPTSLPTCLHLPAEPGTRREISKVEMTVWRESPEGFLEEVLGGLQSVGEDWRAPGTSAGNPRTV